MHLCTYSVVSVDGNQENLKKIKKNRTGANSGFILITFSQEYIKQKVSQAAHAAIFHLFVEDYDDLRICSLC